MSFKIERDAELDTLNYTIIDNSKSRLYATQTGSNTNDVQCNSVNGRIQTLTLDMAGHGGIFFKVQNTFCFTDSVIRLNVVSYSSNYITRGWPIVAVETVINGTFNIRIMNTHTTSLSGFLVIDFDLIK